MYCKFAFATLAVLIGNEFVIAEHIPPTTTAAELWNPWTWFWPYAIAAAEGYRDYFQKAQKATNELYQQAEKLNAFPWITGKPSGQQDKNQGGNGGQNNQGGNSGQNNQGGNSGQNNQGGNSGQNNQGGNSGQNNQGGPTQPNQTGDNGQNNQGGSTQPNQNGDNGQNNQAGPSQPSQPSQGGNQEAPQQQDGKGGAEGSGVQVQGNTQEDGKTDAGVGVNA